MSSLTPFFWYHRPFLCSICPPLTSRINTDGRPGSAIMKSASLNSPLFLVRSLNECHAYQLLGSDVFSALYTLRSASTTRHHMKSTTKHCVVQLQPEFTQSASEQCFFPEAGFAIIAYRILAINNIILLSHQLPSM